MSTTPEVLKVNFRLLGELLGNTIKECDSDVILNKIESIRHLSKTLASEPNSDSEPLVQLLGQLQDDEILPIARAFNQLLNLANIADQEYLSSAAEHPRDGLQELLHGLIERKGKDETLAAIKALQIDLVLTAHPTEATRRTLIRKYGQVADILADKNRTDYLPYERDLLDGRLHRTVAEIWTTDEVRDVRPTPVDEAKWGFSCIENTLWDAVPNFIRQLDRHAKSMLGQALGTEIQPFHFYSWMGGDRDGNPNVTHKTTTDVIMLGRWKAADLYIENIKNLMNDLTMHHASGVLLQQLDPIEDRLEPQLDMPYRAVLGKLKKRLESTLEWAENALQNTVDTVVPVPPNDVVKTRADLLEPLMLCHQSLIDVGLKKIAEGPLLDCIRRVKCFGINLLPLDIRQDSGRHAQVLSELTRYLEMGDYEQWDEDQKQAFLIEQLKSKRPILPLKWPKSDDVEEVLATCRTIASAPKETLCHYVISMAEQASDVLAVALLLKESGISWAMPIVPLFETLDDLTRAPDVMAALWSIPWYRNYCSDRQTVMIGYSDSAKDAGKVAATWAQYQAQEALAALAQEEAITLTLFHGRGGTVGRGGGPVQKAMQSQPPGTVNGRIRVTEQGEMIRYKFGLKRTAYHSLSTYFSATMNATLDPARKPKPEWRDLMAKMSAVSLEHYRSIVREHPQFVPYFRSMTPEQELNKLALGSRPAKRKASGGVESLRAIPWVFAWTQVRLNLPAWLGAEKALDYALKHAPDTLDEMVEDWPFFAAFMDLLEMVVGKADLQISQYYETHLVDENLHEIGQQLRQNLSDLNDLVLAIRKEGQLLDSDPLLQSSLKYRKPYIDPLNYLQVELLKRDRKDEVISDELEKALKVTIAGIAAGMRNTG